LPEDLLYRTRQIEKQRKAKKVPVTERIDYKFDQILKEIQEKQADLQGLLTEEEWNGHV
jgi:predicted lipoprotein